MNYSTKDISIITQVAVKGAIDLLAAGKNNGSLIDDARHIRSVIVRLTDEPVEGGAAPTPIPAVDFAAEVAASNPVQTAADQAFGAVTQAFPGAQVVANPQNVGGTTEAPPFDSRTKDKAQKEANSAWAMARLAERPDEFWDNRPQKASGERGETFPDFKHKDSGVGIWLD